MGKITISTNLSGSASVDTHLWELGEYIDEDTQLPTFIDLDWITGRLAMTTVSLGDARTKVWATILLPN